MRGHFILHLLFYFVFTSFCTKSYLSVLLLSTDGLTFSLSRGLNGNTNDRKFCFTLINILQVKLFLLIYIYMRIYVYTHICVCVSVPYIVLIVEEG